MRNFSVILILFSLFSSYSLKSMAHPFHISMCEVNYNAKEKRLEFALKIFVDDLNKSLEKQNISDQHFGESNEKPDADKVVEQYLKKVFSVKVDRASKAFSFVGKEFENGALWTYFEIDNIPSFKQLEFRNSLLFDLYADQQNIIQVTYQGETKSLLLQPAHQSDKLSY